MIATGFVAARQSLDLDNTNAALTMVISTVIAFFVFVLVGLVTAAVGIAGMALTGGLN
jgi:hypothetical protein